MVWRQGTHHSDRCWLSRWDCQRVSRNRENSVAFMVMVLLFRINEKIVTPTTVILMTMATIPGFLVHLFWLKDFSPAVMGYWLAAVPIVAVGAPLGALICSYMSSSSDRKCSPCPYCPGVRQHACAGADLSYRAARLGRYPPGLRVSGLVYEPSPSSTHPRRAGVRGEE